MLIIFPWQLATLSPQTLQTRLNAPNFSFSLFSHLPSRLIVLLIIEGSENDFSSQSTLKELLNWPNCDNTSYGFRLFGPFCPRLFNLTQTLRITQKKQLFSPLSVFFRSHRQWKLLSSQTKLKLLKKFNHVEIFFTSQLTEYRVDGTTGCSLKSVFYNHSLTSFKKSILFVLG